MKFNYHWVDENGKHFFTTDKKQAELALKNGYYIELVPNGRIAS